MTSSYEEYAGLGETGYVDQQPVAPEDEFFHSVYIAGKTRKNHAEIEEVSGKLQVRGVEYNLESVNIIITHVKKILMKTIQQAGRQKTDCFSFKKTPQPPWFGYNNRQCGTNSGERAASDFCKDCREQIIIGGIYCDESGNPVLKDDKPIFVFLRGKGTKYNNVSQYLSEMFHMELDPIFEPVTEKSKFFEKATVNNKRFVTHVGMGKADSAHGEKDVFVFEAQGKLPTKVVMDVLRIAKETQEKFGEKIDWSKEVATGYSQASVPDENIIPDVKPSENKKAESKTNETSTQQVVDTNFDFENIQF